MPCAALFSALALPTVTYAGFITGDMLKDWAKAHEAVDGRALSTAEYVTDQVLKAMQFLGFVAAVVDSNLSMGRFVPEATDPAQSVTYFCIPTNATLNQVASVASKHVLDHPEDWHKEGHIIVVDALFEAFPCPDSNP